MPTETLLQKLRPCRRLHPALRYAATTLLILLAFATRWVLSEPLAEYPFLLFIPVVMLVALVFNRGAGLYATALAAMLGLIFFALPEREPALAPIAVALPLAVFVLVGTFSSLVLKALRNAIDRLEAANRQQVMLLDEVHHRVRNNLQSIVSLLHLQARAVERREIRAEDALRAAAARVGVMGRVHERLGRPGDAGGGIDAGSFIAELCTELRGTFGANHPVTIRTDVEPIRMEVGHAILLGLIVNELVTNAFEHAFADGQNGTVEVRFQRQAGRSVRLEVRDNGRGIAAGTPSGLGQQLIQMLSTSLGGTVHVHTNGGTIVALDIPVSATPVEGQE